ncbi:hypothetical protein [Sphingomonas sp. H160509]|uniref:hypothetical protein n=1 Tax=Sphingomonas sp. H160509 TaxID=2955313 RepID=UPI00406D4529
MWRLVLAAGLFAVGVPAAARDTIGIYQGWGAFRDASPARCYAIARPVMAGGVRPGLPALRRGRSGVCARPCMCGSVASGIGRRGVTLTIGERRFALVANGLDAWAGDAPSDRAIVAAMRSGRSMSVEAVGVGGRPFVDVYALSGAATAVDAAVLACSGGVKLRASPAHRHHSGEGRGPIGKVVVTTD